MQHIRRHISEFSFLMLPVLLVLLVSTSSAFGSRGTAPQNLPPYDYVSDGDLVQSCKLFLLDKTSVSMCPHYIQGFMDAKLKSAGNASQYCVPYNFAMRAAVQNYLERFQDLRNTSLYYKSAPASGRLNIWLDEYFACSSSDDGRDEPVAPQIELNND